MIRATLATAAALMLVAAPLRAESTLPPAPLANVQLDDPVKEAKARALMATIRCLVCQGEAISDSNAELAGDMRSMIRQRIQAGEEPEAVRAWLVRRYGSWVSYEPPLSRVTFVLWAAPVLFVLIGIIVAGGTLRRRRR